MHTKTRHTSGFTMIEVLLVMVVISMVIYMGINYVQQRTTMLKIDRTSAQIQQILNASLAHYVASGTWPDLSATSYSLTGTNPLQPTYLPSGTINNPYGQPFSVYASSLAPQLLYVYTSITGSTTTGSAVAAATIISGRLPFSYTTITPGTPPPNDGTCKTTGTTSPASCYVVSAVNIPGQNLNNATAVNFAGIYHNGGCVPVPNCPVDAGGNTMTPQIMVVPVSVVGASNSSSTTSIYPINSFTAYVSGPPAAATAGSGPAKCTTDSGSSTICYLDSQGGTAIADNQLYWRACMQIVTSQGEANWGNDTSSTNWGQNAVLMAITRCSIAGGNGNPGEPSGSQFTVWAP